MCGIIAVFIDNKEDKHFENRITKGFEKLYSRGPDNNVKQFTEKEKIGFTRLCINDLTDAGNQPIRSETSKAILMCNGEIYNYKELKEEYNLNCKSNSDCEVILKLYEKIGFIETIKKLDGVYAIVIIDGDNVYLARDRIGVRPLFVGYTDNNNFAVASVAKALTPFCNNIKQFQPSMMIYNRKSGLITKENHRFLIKSIDSNTIQYKIKNLLIRAVSKRLMSDRPIGCLLSGGVDSSLVASILCRLIGHKNVRTYSIGMEGSSDLLYAKKVAEYLNTKHTEVIFTPEEGINAIPEVINSLESYDVTTVRASVGMYLLCKYIKQNTKDVVIFSGEGSDELLAGYLYFHFAKSGGELAKESFRLVKDLYMYDVLRADRTVSVHGLELRVPFLDKDFVDFSMSLTGDQKKPIDGFEKFILRDAFRDDFLPNSVLWRRKCAFSDGVSPISKSWFQHIQDHTEKLFSDKQLKESNLLSKEALWYKNIFNEYFPDYQPDIYLWMPKWVDVNDPSARMIKTSFEKD